MANKLIATQHQQRKVSKSPPKKKSGKESVDMPLDPIHAEKVKELEEKLVNLKKLLRNGRKHAGIELLVATTKKRLAKAREMCDIHMLIQVKSKHLESHSDDEATVQSKSKGNPSKSLSQEYGNYYNMRCNILHMENHKQAIIDTKGLQGFLSDYQKKLAKCFQFEQSQTVQDLFATSRIQKLSEQTIESSSPSPRATKTMKSTVSEESMREVTMEQDMDTLVSMDRSWSSQLDSPVDAEVRSETNFLDQFLRDKVMEFLEAAARPGDFRTTFPLFAMGNVAECVSDSRLAHLMTVRTKNSRSAESVTNDFVNIKPSGSRGKSSDVIPIKHATAMTNIKNVILSL